MIFLLLGVCWALCKTTLLSCGQKDNRASVTPSVSANPDHVWLARFPQHPKIPLKYAPGITLSSPLEESRRLVPSSEIGVAWAQSCEGRKATFPLTHMVQWLAPGFIGSQQQPFISDGCAICFPSSHNSTTSTLCFWLWRGQPSPPMMPPISPLRVSMEGIVRGILLWMVS